MVDLLDRFESEDVSRTSSAGKESSAGRGGRQPQRAPANPFDEVEIGSLQAQPHHRMTHKPQQFPLFKRQEARFSFPSGGITHMVSSGGVVTLVMVGNIIYRLNPSNPKTAEHYEIKREDDRIHKLFQDPTGQHVLISMAGSKECYYIGRATGKKTIPRLLPKVKGHLIESVAWNKLDSSDSGTGPILLGTNTGYIFETDISFEESILKRRAHFTEVYQLMYDLSDHSEPITGLNLEPFPDRTSTTQAVYYVLATTPKRIYEFIGTVQRGESPQFPALFELYRSNKAQFLEIPGNLKDSQLHVWPVRTTPRSFAWLTGAGIYYGTLGFGDHKPGESLFLEKTLIPYSQGSHSETSTPVGMALTEFHCLLLYRDRVEAVCVLNQAKVFEDQVNVRRDGPLFSMSLDSSSGNIYVHQKFKVWIYTPHQETRNIWKIFLEQGLYEKAKNYAKGNQDHMDTIVIQQAEHYFKQGRYQDAALSFSQSQLSFEEVALKFIQVGRKDALKIFLHKKLEALNSKEHSTQQTMLTTWLTELYLNDLGCLSDEGEVAGHKRMQTEFHKFLQQQSLKECLEENKMTVYGLISSHGAVEDLVFFATLMKDYEKVITHCIQQYRYRDALQVLVNQSTAILALPEAERKSKFRGFTSLVYKFSPALMRQCAKDTVETWISMGKYIDAKKLIPALVQCNQPPDPQQVSASIKYLEFCVNKLSNTDRAIHNFLVSEYALNQEPGSYTKLVDYLVRQSKAATVSYDPQYALRLCIEKGLDEPCVYVYAAMGMYEESVDLALKVDVDLARTIANSPLRSKEVQKKLWLKIAQHVIKKEKDIEKAMLFLEECSLLKIEDILPFFPDFVTIDHFKDAICSSLTDYNAHIDDLKTEMKGATDSAKNIRADIQEIRHKCVMIQSDSRCQICEGRLLSQGFYMFPCHHAFHRDCLVHEVKTFLSESETNKLSQLLTLLSVQSSSSEQDMLGHNKTVFEESRVQLDSLVGSECLYCGDRMIQSIQQPFLHPSLMEEAIKSWQ